MLYCIQIYRSQRNMIDNKNEYLLTSFYIIVIKKKLFITTE